MSLPWLLQSHLFSFLSFSSIALWILEEDGRSCMNGSHRTDFTGEFLSIVLQLLNNCLVPLTGVRDYDECCSLVKAGMPAASFPGKN